jgi:hypothetical protein
MGFWVRKSRSEHARRGQRRATHRSFVAPLNSLCSSVGAARRTVAACALADRARAMSGFRAPGVDVCNASPRAARSLATSPPEWVR